MPLRGHLRQRPPAEWRRASGASWLRGAPKHGQNVLVIVSFGEMERSWLLGAFGECQVMGQPDGNKVARCAVDLPGFSRWLSLGLRQAIMP